MGNNNLVLVDTDDLREMIQEAVKEAVNECLPAAIPDEKKFYTIKDVAQKWGVCEQTIWRYAKLGRIKASKVGEVRERIHRQPEVAWRNESGRSHLHHQG